MRLYGYRADEAIGQHASILAPTDDVGQALGNAIRASLAREGAYEGPHRLYNRSGPRLRDPRPWHGSDHSITTRDP